MMRGPSNWAVAVRRPDGRISEVDHAVKSVAATRRWLRLPILRGMVALVESLAIGMRALAVSAHYAATEEGEEDASETLGRWAIAGSLIFALVFSIALFKVSPALLTGLFPVASGSPVFVLIEGAVRVGILVAYLALIGLVGDLRRVFQYHAAEHKAINAYEAGDPLEPEVVQRHSLIHVRCGTAFLLWVMIISIFVFTIVGEQDWPALIASRIVALPLDRGHRLRGHPPRRALQRQPRRARHPGARPVARSASPRASRRWIRSRSRSPRCSACCCSRRSARCAARTRSRSWPDDATARLVRRW